LATVRAFFCLSVRYTARMGMKLGKIRYHLERADAARAEHAIGAALDLRARRWGTHLERAAMHDNLAAQYIAEGLREYANRAQTKGAIEQRRRRVRRARANPGPGRGIHNRGRVDWGAHQKRDSDKPD